MRTVHLWILTSVALLCGAPAGGVFAEESGGNPKEEAALEKNAEAFVEAFHKGDATALAAFWTADGDYTDQTGRRMVGRDAIEKAFKEFFAEHKDMKLRINIGAVRFL